MFYGVAALQGDTKALVAGMIPHLGASVFYGILFSFCVSRPTPLGIALLYAMIYSVLIWIGMTYLVLPLVNPLMQEREALQPGWWFGSHLVFGVLLFLTPILKSVLAKLGEPTSLQGSGATYKMAIKERLILCRIVSPKMAKKAS